MCPRDFWRGEMEKNMKKMSKLLLAFLMILSMFGINDVNALDNESLLDKFPNTIEVLKDFFRDSGKYQIF